MENSADHPLRLFNSLTRELEPFSPIHPGEARVYTCGPTVYNYQHIGNMRAYIFADLLGRTLSWKGYKLTHVVNITDVGHLTSDADAGDDKMEKAAAKSGRTAWEIADFYAKDFEHDLDRLNIRKPAHPRATDYVETMIEWGKAIAPKHGYELESGLYFDTSTIPNYGSLARANTDEGEGRIEQVAGKRNHSDFAIWRKTPAGETRQMEWDSPWGRGAPGWHLECSVMSKELLGHPFDIHTGGIDHREIHHPNEIAQNQALGQCEHSGARYWMHNNFLIDRVGKMSKSSGDFLRLQLLVDKGIHPLAYRLMVLQAHYRSELEFTWESLIAAFTRLKRLILGVENLKSRFAASDNASDPGSADQPLHPKLAELRERLSAAMSEDLNSSQALPLLDELLALKKVDPVQRMALLEEMDSLFGLNLTSLSRADLRVRPLAATISEAEIAAKIEQRRQAKADRDFAVADNIRDELIAQNVELMDGDPLGWDWRIII